MAFQQPQRHPHPRHSSVHSPPAALPPVLNTVSATTRDPFIEQSQEWVLFSAGPQPTDDGQSSQTPRTVGRSHISDTRSLDTAAVSDKSQPHDEAANAGHQNLESRHHEQEVDADADGDLDSLDDGLHAFGAIEQSTTVLPAHDGLGMFPGTSSPVQEQLWQHERYNPHRQASPAALERHSLDQRAKELDNLSEPRNADEERFLRIEKWRLDQSRAILNEIERETRRLRRKKRVSESRGPESLTSSRVARSAPEPSSIHRAASVSTAAHRSTSQPPKRESLWEVFKRRVIRDLMGLDDATLSYIFGESLPAEAVEEGDESSPRDMIHHAERTVKERHALVRNTDSWEEKLLARIAQELGLLLHQISEHPGAFSTYMKTQEPIPYAGLVNPKASRSNLRAGQQRTQPRQPHFQPTLGGSIGAHRRQSSNANSDPALWGIGEELEAGPSQPQLRQRQHEVEEEEREYWERDLDIKMVFGFLRSRLTSSSSEPVAKEPNDDAEPDPAACLVSPTPTSMVTPTTNEGDVLRRAALVRKHHPLVSRKASTSSRPAAAFVAHRRQSSLSAPLSPVLGRRDSSVIDGAESCASQSTKKSKTVHSGSLGGSSRNYWDLGGGSMGSAWGEA